MSQLSASHLKLLNIFAVVVENGSFAAAAKKLNSSRSRVSEQVAGLELHLGVRLLQRTTRQLNLTDEGNKVFEHARLLDDILRQVESIVSPPSPSGRVTLTLNHDIAHKYLLPVLPDLKQRYPDVELDLYLADDKLDLIAQNIDLAIRIGMPADSSLIGRMMHQERFALYSSPALLGNRTPTTLESLRDFPWIGLQQTSNTNAYHLLYNNETVAIKPTRIQRCNSPYAAQKMVVAGLGICPLLPSTMYEDEQAGKVVKIMPQVTSEPVLFSLVYPSRRQIPLRTQVVIDYLMQANIFENPSRPVNNEKPA